MIDCHLYQQPKNKSDIHNQPTNNGNFTTKLINKGDQAINKGTLALKDNKIYLYHRPINKNTLLQTNIPR